MSLFALVVTTALAAPVAAPEAALCSVAEVAATSPVDKTAPLLVSSSPVGRMMRGRAALSVQTELEVDEQHTRFLVTGDKPLPTVRHALALPAPWSGHVELVPRAGASTWCARVDVVLFDRELRRAELEGLPLDVVVTVARAGQAPRTRTLAPELLVVTPETIALGADASSTMLFLAAKGRTLPRDELLQGDGLGADAARFMAGLAALFPDVADDIRKDPSRDAQRVLFAEMAASLRVDLRLWTPERRVREIGRFDEAAMTPELRPLLRFWKAELGARARSKGRDGENARRDGANARLIVDDGVTALWIDGMEVFDRAKGMPTSIEVRVPDEGVRAWIVSREQRDAGGTFDVVHDTRAVLRPGEIYSVTSTFVQHVRGGTRRECVRVGGKLPLDKDIRWREVSGARTALLGESETYRPSVSSAERVITVVPGGDLRPFPPVPLVYSYTHPGTYKWTLGANGRVKLELVDDEALCKGP